jgi:hypothetical protein
MPRCRGVKVRIQVRESQTEQVVSKASCTAQDFSVAACSLIFCLAPACCTAADFFAFVSALFASSFASSFASAAFAFAAFAAFALIVNSFAVSSASKDSWRKFFGMRIDMPKPSA